MTKRALPQKEQPVPLSLAAGKRIVTPGLDPVLGWIGNENARIAQALIFPQWLLDPSPTENIAYACNLPAPSFLAHPEQPASPGAPGSAAEAQFLAASLSGGQVSIVSAEGKRSTIAFRWMCVTAHASIGAVWRCYLKLRTPSSPWTPAGQDYVFEAGGGFPINVQAKLKVTLCGHTYNLTHPEGRFTCFPSQSGRVKVAQASADGWAKRELQNLLLYPDRSIVARFSDGAETRVATAAPARAAATVAA